jgi:hypothetical protein
VSDTYGALELPMATGDFGGKAVDPALDAITSYLLAVLPARLGAAWDSVAPGEQLIKSTLTVSPKDSLIAPAMLPALFVWRGAFQQTREADDYLVTRTQLGCMWLLWWDSPLKREKRLPFQGAVTKVIHEALARGRNPAWIAPSDRALIAAGTDPTDIASRGSVLLEHAGLFEPIEKINGSEMDVVLDQERSGQPVAYKALSLTIQIAERMARDPAIYSVPSVNTTDPDNANAGAGFSEAAALDLTVAQGDDNTIRQLQPAP